MNRPAICKDVVTAVVAAPAVSDHGHVRVVAAANASAPRGPEHAATLGGISSNRNAAGAHAVAAETEHSCRAAGRASRKNLPEARLGAGPRTALQPAAAPPPPPGPPLPPLPGPLELRWLAAALPNGLPAAADDAPDSAGLAADDSASPARWPGSVGHSATAATVRLAAGRLRCNTAAAAVRDETRVRTPSTDTAAAGSGNGSLESAVTRRDTEVGPRERPTPRVKSRRRAGTCLRDVLIGSLDSSIATPAQGSQQNTEPRCGRTTEWRTKIGRPALGRY
jgi:hypothetical protein